MEIQTPATRQCLGCGYILQLEERGQQDSDGNWMHERCADDIRDGHVIIWRNAETVARLDWEERELERIKPLSKKGKCPVCFIELPQTGSCDEHGRPA